MKPRISQKAAQSNAREIVKLRDQLVEALNGKDASDRREAALRGHYNAAQDRLALVKGAKCLTEIRDIAEWKGAPEHVQSAIEVAKRIGCVVIVEHGESYDYATSPPTTERYIVVKSAREVKV